MAFASSLSNPSPPLVVSALPEKPRCEPQRSRLPRNTRTYGVPDIPPIARKRLNAPRNYNCFGFTSNGPIKGRKSLRERIHRNLFSSIYLFKAFQISSSARGSDKREDKVYQIISLSLGYRRNLADLLLFSGPSETSRAFGSNLQPLLKLKLALCERSVH